MLASDESHQKPVLHPSKIQADVFITKYKNLSLFTLGGAKSSPSPW
jgi:hypothetical protein